MRAPEVRTITLANHHVCHVWFRKTGNRVTAFVVQLVRLVGSDAFEVYRADTAHGHLHEHTWHHGRERIRDLEACAREDYTEALAHAWTHAKETAHADDPTRRGPRPDARDRSLS